MSIVTSANNAITSVNNKIICRNLPGELNNLCKQKDIPKPLKYIIITLYDYLTLPMYYWRGESLGVGNPCSANGVVSEYNSKYTPSFIKENHDSKLEKLKNSLKNKIIDFFKGLDGKEIENHVKNIINAEEKTIIDLKENRYRITVSVRAPQEFKIQRREGTWHVTCVVMEI